MFGGIESYEVFICLVCVVDGEGNVWTALAHLIAGVIGSGVLSMAWSMAQLGWIAGPLSIILIAFFSLVSAFLISNIQLCSNHPSITINRSYLQAVHTILGEADRVIIIYKHHAGTSRLQLNIYLLLYFGSKDIRMDWYVDAWYTSVYSKQELSM